MPIVELLVIGQYKTIHKAPRRNSAGRGFFIRSRWTTVELLAVVQLFFDVLLSQ
jgi:hypothetical protein